MDVQITDFSSLIAEEKQGPPSILLGNGFSCTLYDNIFSYDNLFNNARSTMSSNLASLFEGLGTRDFERILGVLKNGANLMQHYYHNMSHTHTLQEEAVGLQEKLITAIADGHPQSAFNLTEQNYIACGNFLKKFQYIFTTNYDLLLQWVLVKILSERQFKDFFFDDGKLFWHPTDEAQFKQEVYYLHGALHIFRYGTRYSKIKYEKSESPSRMIEQIQKRIREGEFPLFVCEESAEQKKEQIQKDTYLRHAFTHLCYLNGSLYIYGSSMSLVDEHLWKSIGEASLKRLCVSLHGSNKNQNNVISNAQKIAHQYKQRNQNLDIRFYHASSAPIWKSPSQPFHIDRAAW